jgi:hypothetical protein
MKKKSRELLKELVQEIQIRLMDGDKIKSELTDWDYEMIEKKIDFKLINLSRRKNEKIINS